jgi:hypothetical protein
MNREKLDVVANILNAIEKDALQGHIMQKCGLSTKQFKEYIPMLLKSGLIDGFPAVDLQHMPGPNSKCRMVFHVSRSGKRFLELYSELCALVDRCVANSSLLRSTLYPVSLRDRFGKRPLQHTPLTKGDHR